MKNIVLLIFSLFFYAWGEPLYILLMIASIAINYFAALLIGKARDAGREKLAKLWIIVDVAVNLGLLGVFKYLGFFTEIINLIPGVSLPIPRIVLPIGISFYTFQIMSYVVDVYRGKVPAQRNIFFLGAYLAAFPQLIAGPVVLYETDAAELNERHASLEDITVG
jgi:alginate O-acetyltransferase complex protein AlgI